jgi:iron complex transport system ATP-binding protein
MSSLIACENVGYRQQGLDILSDIDWRIERGQHWAVSGPNGSGKTTLLRIACGYLWPTSGRVLRLGRELLDLIELRRSIGWISSEMLNRIPASDTGLETVVTGRLAQVGLKLFPTGGPTEEDFRDATRELALLGCEALAKKPFGVLSQGERQQVLIARARMAKPLLLVLDEPCAGMDPGVRERFLQWLEERLEDESRMTNDEFLPQSSPHRSPTTILVTHHIEEIVPSIKNALILHGGRTYSTGAPEDVITRRTIETVYDTRLSRIEHSGGRLWPIWGT